MCASNDLWQELLRKDFGIEHGGRDGLHARTLYNLHAHTPNRGTRGGAAHGILPSHARSFTASRLGTRRRPRHLSWNSRSRARYHRGRLRFVAGLESNPPPRPIPGTVEAVWEVPVVLEAAGPAVDHRSHRNRVAYRTIQIPTPICVTLGHPGRRTSRFSNMRDPAMTGDRDRRRISFSRFS